MCIRDRNDYNLNIPRYVDTFEEDEPVDLKAITTELLGLESKMAETEATISMLCNELNLSLPDGFNISLLQAFKKGCMQQLFSQDIRFKNENGQAFPDWEQIRLGDVAQFSRGKGISKANIAKNGENFCIRYGELYTEYKEYIKAVVSKTDTPLKGAVLSTTNDVLMPTSDVTPSGLATASALSIPGIILGGDILIIRSKRILNRYLAHYVSAHKNDIMRLVTGVTVYHIYGKDMASLQICLPHIDEQRKIADFLSALDTKIDLIAQDFSQTPKNNEI